MSDTAFVTIQLYGCPSVGIYELLKLVLCILASSAAVSHPVSTFAIVQRADSQVDQVLTVAPLRTCYGVKI
jgi:hypothetical protein